MLLLLCACDFSAATTVAPSDSGASSDDTGDPSAGDTARDTEETHDSAPPDPFETDDDGDGVSENDGDCDDDDRTVFPGATDRCNGLDDDCDGALDEDAEPDGYEPNDSDAVSIGDLDDDPELTAVGTLSGEDDVDRYAFTFTDSGWSLFSIQVSLTGIPDDATWRLTLNRLSSDGDLEAEEVDQVFGSESLSLTMDDVSLQEDGGTYELVVEAIAGADCGRSYLLSVGW